MKDDPKKHRIDARFLSSQPHELVYLRRKLARMYPKRTAEEIALAIPAVRKAIQPSESRPHFMAVIDLMLR